MRMIDLGRNCSVKVVAMYLAPSEARQLVSELNKLLETPEANEHFHVYEADMSREISCSIITEKKLANLKQYNKLEQEVLSED